MILGTANFCNDYREVQLDKDKCIEILDEYVSLGGRKLQSSFKYGNAVNILLDYCYGKQKDMLLYLKESDQEALKVFTYKGFMIYADEYIHDIYYPSQISPEMKMISIPASKIFLPYIDVMKLHAKVYCRSIYQLPDGHEMVQYCDDVIVGVENVEQLREDMELYGK